MSGRIPESFIDELMNRVDIVEVIESRLQLKRSGSEFQACCPFHEEKTPSFTVSPRKQFYHCFGCGEHGTAIGFLMAYDGLEFVDAVESLARQAGLDVPREAGGRPPVAEGLYDLLEAAAVFYQEQLKSTAQAVDYLKSRGLSGEISRDFGVGYAPPGWDSLLRHLGHSEKDQQRLLKAGLLSQGDKGLYDKFRHRIMFPIHDRRGRVIGFGGRALEDRGPKYLNSPETELFHKGRELYGLYLARKRSTKLDRLLVVEGYMDVVALAQFGINNAVATLGTATTEFQADLLFRSAAEVVYSFDGDRAGQKAAWRALESTLKKLRDGRQARFLFLPDGEDPDSIIRKEGREAFEQRLAQAVPLSEFFFQHLSDQTDMHSLEGRARLVELARPYLEQLGPGVLSEMLNRELALRAHHDVQIRPVNRKPGKPRAMATRTPVRAAVAQLLQEPGLAAAVPDWAILEGGVLPGLDLLCELIEFCTSRPNITTAKVLELLRDHPAANHLGVLAAEELHVTDETRDQSWFDSLAQISKAVIKKKLNRITEAQRQGLITAAEKDELRELTRLKSALSQIVDEI